MGKKRTAVPREITLPDIVVLSVLSENPMHGYQLVTELEIREVRDWAAISRPQVYYSLKKLLALRLISEFGASDASLGPEKTTYQVNAKGRNELAAALSLPHWAEQRSRPSFLTWMALSTHLSKGAVRKLFDARRTYLQAELNRERATLKSFKDAEGAMLVAGKLMVELTVREFEVELEWLDSAEAQMLARK